MLTPRQGRDEGMPRHPTSGLPAPHQLEDPKPVHPCPHPTPATPTEEGKQAPPEAGGARTMIPISGLHPRRRQGQALRAACGRP
jgi:hypothetical protein